MAFWKLHVNIWLIFSAITAYHHDDNSEDNIYVTNNYRLPDDVVPVHYDIKIIPYIKEDNFIYHGESNINIKILRPTRTISLHALNLRINEKATTLIDSSGLAYPPAAHFYNNTMEILILNFNNKLPPQSYMLNMKFVGILHEETLGIYRKSYKNEEGNTMWMIATQFEATWARRAFPCWDEPALKATFDISIKHHRNYTALSNMPGRMQVTNGCGKEDLLWTQFQRTPVMSTYIVAFVVADFVRIPTKDETINIWCRSQLVPYSKLIQKAVERSEHIITEYINMPHMVPKMDHVAIPGFQYAMENWGLIFYSEKYFVYDATSNTTISKHDIAITVTHEVAHQWFGNIASPVWWSYLWLKEGFASYFEVYFTDQMFQNWKVMDLFIVKDQEFLFQIDAGNDIKPITSKVNSPSEIAKHYSLSNYKKAPVIIRMLHHIMTDKVFQKGLHNYIQTHQYSSATPNDLWLSLQTALDKSEVPHDEYRLKEVMNTWVKQQSYPVVTLTRNYDTGEIILRQRHFRSDIWSGKNVIDNEEAKWWIPLNFATQTNPNFNNTQPTHWLRPGNQNKSIHGIDPNDWIIVNIQQTGYYIVNYDEKNWQRIADYLNSDKYMEIHVLNRAQIISNAFLLLTANQIPVSIFFNLMDYIPRETDYIAWYPVFTILKTIWNDFDLRGNQFLRQYLYKIFDAFIEEIGYDESSTEDDLTKLTRVEVLHWACTFHHFECKQTATIKLDEHLTDPKTHKISPNLKDWTYCMGIMEANISTWNKLYNTYLENPTNKKILNYLSCSKNLNIFFYLSNMLEVHYSKLENVKYYLGFHIVLYSQINNDKVFDYILQKLKYNFILSIYENLWCLTFYRQIYKYYILNAMITKATTQQRLHKIGEYLKNDWTPESARIQFRNNIKQRESYLLENAEKYATLRKAILTKFT